MLNGVFLEEINNCEKLKNKLEVFLKELIEWENDRIENNSLQLILGEKEITKQKNNLNKAAISEVKLMLSKWVNLFFQLF
uniref:Uncharacterized protein n=1 Tax=Meloidogyne incognita TaxID=6306 RepID=A0A914NDH9_MELIC